MRSADIKRFDVIIIGAGPCGMFSALRLADSHSVGVIEAGLPLEQKKCPLERIGKCLYCKPVCNILGGFGGAQFFEGTKLSRYPAGSGLLNFCESLESLEKMYDTIDQILEGFGKVPRDCPSAQSIMKLAACFEKAGFDFKYYNAQKVSKSTMNTIALNIYRKLTALGTKFFFCEQVLDIQGEDNNFEVTTTKARYQCKKVVLAVGRLGSRQLTKIADKIGIQYEIDQQIEIGVRVEAPYHVFNKINNVHNDLKLKRRICGNEEVRSFCQDYKGYITKCVHNLKGDLTVSTLDGHIIGTDEEGGNRSEVVNLAIHHRFPHDAAHGDVYDIVGKMNKNNKPMVQTMKSFILDIADNENFSNKLSMPDVERANINDYLPTKTALLIKDFIHRIDRIVPGFAADKNAVYAPSFEMGWKKMVVASDLQSTVRGIYIGGDITGHFRGAMQAMASGLLIADSLNRTVITAVAELTEAACKNFQGGLI